MKIVVYVLSVLNTVAIKKALCARNLADVSCIKDIPYGSVDPSINFLIAIFDESLRDYDINHWTNDMPDWREDVAFDGMCHNIESMHRCFPSAKIMLVDITSMHVDDLAEECLDIGVSKELIDLHRVQWEREVKVWERLREKYFKEGYCVAEKFRLTAMHQGPMANRIADIIAGSQD